MSIQKTLGGERLGSGKRMKVELHNYERSTHDLGFVWRSTMAPGTLVPFLVEVGLPGDTFDINLNADVKTTPTVGPLFGSFKLQLDIFECPIRLYHKSLHNNKLGLGMDMAKVKLPTITLIGPNIDIVNNTAPIELQQFSQSSLVAYLGTRGLGNSQEGANYITEKVNAIPVLAYWDIVKNYYANKQEENAFVVHNTAPVLTTATVTVSEEQELFPTNEITAPDFTDAGILKVIGVNINSENLYIQFTNSTARNKIKDLFREVYVSPDGTYVEAKQLFSSRLMLEQIAFIYLDVVGAPLVPRLVSFPLENIDLMRDAILSASDATAFDLDSANANAGYTPYTYLNTQPNVNELYTCSVFPMEGLAVKTYQSDIFNNWISTEWIDGENGIAAISAVAIVDNMFTIDTLNLSKKVYDMLNRIAVSGGSYEDWLEAVFTHESYWKAETPMYMGGLSKEIIFQEVVSTAEATELNPLGSLAGKGTLASKHKGGHVTIKVDEPCYIIGIVSITPRIDYSQGNAWHMHLKTLDDLHKPALDQIGYQDLLCEQMAFWDTGFATDGTPIVHSAGKQPAWINYMTSHNKCYGNFADSRSQMYMTLNRRYTRNAITGRISDLTTYIDPAKFNYAFAQTDMGAQNFMVQIGNDITARRKMSAKVMPNL